MLNPGDVTIEKQSKKGDRSVAKNNDDDDEEEDEKGVKGMRNSVRLP